MPQSGLAEVKCERQIVLFPLYKQKLFFFYYNVLRSLSCSTNRIELLMQTPGSPIAGGKSGGREPSKRIILICNGSTQGNTEV